MIGELPKSLNINGTERAIRSDFRTALLIFQGYNDMELSDQEKVLVMLECLYVDFEDIPEAEFQEMSEKAVWFLDGGSQSTANENKSQRPKKLMDWEQDEQMIFSAVNNTAGFETRATEYLHWWTFLGFFNEIGEGLFSTIISIRQKQAKGKKLEKYEQEFVRENKGLIELKQKYTAEEQAEIDRLNKLLG